MSEQSENGSFNQVLTISLGYLMVQRMLFNSQQVPDALLLRDIPGLFNSQQVPDALLLRDIPGFSAKHSTVMVC